MPPFGALALTVGLVGLVGMESQVIRDSCHVRDIHFSLYIAANVLGAVVVVTAVWTLLAGYGIPWARQSEDLVAIPLIISVFTLVSEEFTACMVFLFRMIERSSQHRP